MRPAGATEKAEREKDRGRGDYSSKLGKKYQKIAIWGMR